MSKLAVVIVSAVDHSLFSSRHLLPPKAGTDITCPWEGDEEEDRSPNHGAKDVITISDLPNYVKTGNHCLSIGRLINPKLGCQNSPGPV